MTYSNHPNSVPPTEKQLNYLEVLRHTHFCDRMGAVGPEHSKRDVSEAIEWALRQPKRKVPSDRANVCKACWGMGVFINAGKIVHPEQVCVYCTGAGYYAHTPTTSRPKPTLVRKIEPGAYVAFDVHGGRKLLRVVKSRGKDQYYAQEIVVSSDGKRVAYQYAPGWFDRLGTADNVSRLTLEEAAKLGISTKRCIDCGKPLKVALSQQRGIGPVCYKRYKRQTNEFVLTEEGA